MNSRIRTVFLPLNYQQVTLNKEVLNSSKKGDKDRTEISIFRSQKISIDKTSKRIRLRRNSFDEAIQSNQSETPRCAFTFSGWGFL